MKIYSSGGEVILDVIVDDDSYRNRAIMGDHNLTLHFALAEHVELPVGAWCEFQAVKYYLMRPEALMMKHTRHFEYTAVFESDQYRAGTWKMRCIYTDEKKAELSDGSLEFSLTATALEHLQMVVDNLNYRSSGWDVGECVDGGTKTVSYNHNSVLEALKMIADEFETEFEIAGKTVSLHRLSYYKTAPLALSYGRGNGIRPDVRRSNTDDVMPVERLWVQGGKQNIDRSKYGAKRLHLPKGGTLGYDGEHFEGEDGFDSSAAKYYAADSKGMCITRSDKALATNAEDSLDCTEVYPKRVGTVGQVVVRDAEKNWYDIYDEEIPDSLDYNQCLIDGEEMTIIFQTGMLAGKEFGVNRYNHGEGRQERYFELTPQEIDGEVMPNSVFTPAEGDTYAVFGCTLPDAYINDAATKTGSEWEMMRQAMKYMWEHEEEKYTISASLDGIWAKKDWVNVGGRIRLGSWVKFTDGRFFPDGVLVRITGVKDYVNRPHSPEIELSNDAVSSGFSTSMKKIESVPVVIEDARRQSKQYTKRRFQDAQDTVEALQELVEAGFGQFTDGITPITVRTMQMLVGDESLQYRFVSSMTSPKAADPPLTYSPATKQLTAAASIIQHMTLGIADLSDAHSVSEYKFWNVGSYVSAVLDDASKRYYIYIRAEKTTQAAEFILSETVKDMEEEYDYYFLYGILNAEYEGDRSIAELFGFTEILPGRVTTDKIVSSDGLTYFDLAGSVIGGNIKFRSTGGSERSVSSLEGDISALQADIDEAAEKADAANATLTSWASDGKISPTEKTGLKQTLSDIQADYPEVVSRCEHYGVSHAEFDVIYTNAVTALKKYTAATPPVIDIGSDYDNVTGLRVA